MAKSIFEQINSIKESSTKEAGEEKERSRNPVNKQSDQLHIQQIIVPPFVCVCVKTKKNEN